MMTHQEIFDALKSVLEVIRPSTDLSGVNDDTQLTRDLGIDSLSMMLMALAIEDKCGMTFETTHTPFVTVGELISYIQSRQG